MDEECTRGKARTRAQIVAELEAIPEALEMVSHPLRAEDVNDLCGAVSYMARVLAALVEEVAAQQQGSP
jgi:hypothetical protein